MIIKEKILVTALELFLRKGYENTSTKELIRRCEISKGALYYRFTSKEEVMEAAVDYLVEKDFANIDFILKSQRVSSFSKLEKVLGITIMCARKRVLGPIDSIFYRNVTIKTNDKITGIIRELIKECIDNGEIKNIDCEVAVIYVSSAIDILLQNLCGEEIELKFVREFFKICTNILGVDFSYNVLLRDK